MNSPDNPGNDASNLVTAVLFVGFRQPMSRDQLEASTFGLQEVMDKYVPEAQGATASANFETSEIEIDLSLVNVSMSVVHETIARLARALEVYGGIDPSALGSSSGGAPVESAPALRVVRSSEIVAA